MTIRVASLGMYDSPGLAPANDRLWTAIADRLRDAGLHGVPYRLDRSRPLETIWDDPDLLLAQTCGYPFVTHWRGRLRYVATPCYRAPGCDGPTHRSRVVVRRTEPAETLAAMRGRAVALNDRQSNSGANLLRALVAPLAAGGRFFGAAVETGSHRESARLVVAGGADLAAIDAVTYAHLEREVPATTARLRTLAWTLPSPGLPFVTARTTPHREVRLLREAIVQAIAMLPADDADTLLLDGAAILDPRRYDTLRTIERRAATAGYPHLA